VSVSPSTRKGRETRNRLIAAARTVSARDGYTAMRIADVVELAQSSTGALYRYFTDGDDLFAAAIGDLHREFLDASRTRTHNFAHEPYEAMREAHEGYLAHYYHHREFMRAFIEAAHVTDRFRQIWWAMRRDHVERFVHSVKRHHGIDQVDGLPLIVVADGLGAMLEHCAYIWFAQQEHALQPVSVPDAAKIVARASYRTIFTGQAE
jgi:AcrR family transcriptional regulator